MPSTEKAGPTRSAVAVLFICYPFSVTNGSVRAWLNYADSAVFPISTSGAGSGQTPALGRHAASTGASALADRRGRRLGGRFQAEFRRGAGQSQASLRPASWPAESGTLPSFHATRR